MKRYSSIYRDVNRDRWLRRSRAPEHRPSRSAWRDDARSIRPWQHLSRRPRAGSARLRPLTCRAQRSSRRVWADPSRSTRLRQDQATRSSRRLPRGRRARAQAMVSIPCRPVARRLYRARARLQRCRLGRAPAAASSHLQRPRRCRPVSHLAPRGLVRASRRIQRASSCSACRRRSDSLRPSLHLAAVPAPRPRRP